MPYNHKNYSYRLRYSHIIIICRHYSKLIQNEKQELSAIKILYITTRH